MAHHLTKKDVRAIAEYTRIGLSEDEIGQLTIDLNKIVESFAPITEYDLDGVERTFHPIGGLSNVMREDLEGSSFTQEEALVNAGKKQDGYFVVPAILGGGDVS